VLVEIIAVGDVICDSSQLGNGGVFFVEPELSMGKEVLSVDKRCQSDGYDAFEQFSECAEKTNWSVGVRISARFVGFRDGDDFGSLPAGGKEVKKRSEMGEGFAGEVM